jgi:hypothetical protein
MSPRTKELFFLVLRWLGMVGTFVCIASAAGTFALGSLYGAAAHLPLAVWTILSPTFLGLWIFAGRKLRQLPVRR